MPVNALRDENNVPSKLAVLNTDSVQGQNRVRLLVTSQGAIRVNTADTISFSMEPIDPRDKNYVDVWAFEGSDGKVYPAVANSSGELLIDVT